ncbi:dTDP-4-dehydrorhamnose reductase [Paraburkholderia sp. IW21]|uniref:dTDP-4-dehydrorhamnose reductase n=1 Tax=Paraburkholderia sp. IW21 TaxID=3242488 RepID=UPI0035212802
MNSSAATRVKGPVLILGANGQVGFELVRTLAGLGQTHAFLRADMPLDEPDAVRKMMSDMKPSVIVNAAAYTAVDRAESEFEAAKAVNADAPGLLAECANLVGAALVHYSTDYVFDGRRLPDASDAGYQEHDPTGPLNAYGNTKLLGEQAIMAQAKRFLIFRTSWVYGLRGKNFLLTMLRLARDRSELKVVADQYGSPTWSRTIATLTGHVLAQQQAPTCDTEAWWSENSGTYHMTAAGSTSWAGFAREIFREAIPDGSRRPAVVPIPSSEYPTPVERPGNSRLSNEKLQRQFGLQPPEWDDALRQCLGEGAIVNG